MVSLNVRWLGPTSVLIVVSLAVANQRAIFVQRLVNGCINVMRELCDVEHFYSYQLEIADRIFFSLLYGDAAEITIETARQAGKSEIMADVAATAMVVFPLLAKTFPD